ncbi:hypothetical protein CDV31_007010 [Fusarium ambrosium]|uniref:Uncharacterized protein n=1 Tax=Fusarium ambrosium TaxID=131363 RepID=A0A428U991_9HYPO|nr:hypothetical protein CDV31_007010 [Fusarium ambrosium]
MARGKWIKEISTTRHEMGFNGWLIIIRRWIGIAGGIRNTKTGTFTSETVGLIPSNTMCVPTVETGHRCG